MLDAALAGSVVPWLRLFNNRVFVEPLETLYLTPTFDPTVPERSRRRASLTSFTSWVQWADRPFAGVGRAHKTLPFQRLIVTWRLWDEAP